MFKTPQHGAHCQCHRLGNSFFTLSNTEPTAFPATLKYGFMNKLKTLGACFKFQTPYINKAHTKKQFDR